MRRAVVLVMVVCALGAAAARAAGTTPTAAAPAAAPTTAAATGTPPGAGVTYGIADAQGNYAHCSATTPDCCDPSRPRCDLAQLAGYHDEAAFRMLVTPASAHRVTQVRLFVTYDAVQDWNGSTTAPACDYSRALSSAWTDSGGRLHPAGESWRDLLASIREARAQGLEPVVSVAGYASDHAIPPWDQPFPDPTTVGGWWEYHCGLQGILNALSRLPQWEQPHIWEALNEPDGFDAFRGVPEAQAQNCDVSETPAPGGAAKAACVYAMGAEQIHQFAGHATDTVIAGAFTKPRADYLGQYAAALGRVLGRSAYPTVWSVHDYGDVTTAYDGPGSTALATFDAALASDTAGVAQQLWITESGTLLTDRVPGSGCPAAGVDAADTLGACVNGDAGRQARSAAAFFTLPAQGAQVPITHLFWYEFHSATHWDSGLTDAGGRPRQAWCAFYGTATGCDGSPWAS